MISVSAGRPYVSVPVLSKIATRHVAMRSRTAGSRIMIPRLAAREIDPIIATGIAISSGQGVATTRTARNRVTFPLSHQASAASVMASGV